MIGDYFAEVLHLQRQWSDAATELMQRRGILIRDVIPDWFRRNGAASIARGGWAPISLEVQGKDGIGRKSQVPWVRLYSPSESASATEGWYVVYLFSGDGSSCSTPMHASTHAVGDALIPRNEESIRTAVNWARTELGEWMTLLRCHPLALRAPRSKVAEHYEKSVVGSFEYQAGSLPDSDTILADLKDLTGALADPH